LPRDQAAFYFLVAHTLALGLLMLRETTHLPAAAVVVADGAVLLPLLLPLLLLPLLQPLLPPL